MKNGRRRHAPQAGKMIPASQNHVRPVHPVHVPAWVLPGHLRTLSGSPHAFAG
ncbi:MAG: hypothetical protein JNG86_22415 [Verrucomicrobiaceae bacterium]|nr:hypothetical protein [Verrucomicrobiaceae bacterium]